MSSNPLTEQMVDVIEDMLRDITVGAGYNQTVVACSKNV